MSPGPDFTVQDILPVTRGPRWSRVSNPTAPPFGAICRLTIRFPDGNAQGTGWLAGSRLVLTAGHCVFNHDLGGSAAAIDMVFPSGARFQVAGVRAFMSAEAWRRSEAPSADIGGIRLPRDAGGGWLRTQGIPAGLGQTVAIAGYPIDRDGLWSHSGSILGQHGRRVFYDVDADDGQSGAPLLAMDGPRWQAVGLHLHDPDGVPSHVQLPRRANGGLLIDPEVAALLHQWGANR